MQIPQITEWICMQISRNIVNGPKSNNYVFVGIWIIVCSHKPSHYFTFCRLFVHYTCLRLCSAIVHFTQNNCPYFVCYGWSVQTSPKRWFGKHEYDVKVWCHKQRTPNTNDTHMPLNESPKWKFSAYATGTYALSFFERRHSEASWNSKRQEVNRRLITRGVTRLDGARGKKQVWRSHVRSWGLSETNALYWKKLLVTFGATRSRSASS